MRLSQPDYRADSVREVLGLLGSGESLLIPGRGRPV